MNIGKGSVAWILPAVLVAAGSLFAVIFAAGANSAPPPRNPLKPGDDAAYDWEAPGHPQATDSGSWTYAVRSKLVSSRTFHKQRLG
jgi:hypothetical protein